MVTLDLNTQKKVGAGPQLELAGGSHGDAAVLISAAEAFRSLLPTPKPSPFLRSLHRLRQRGALAYIKAMIVSQEQQLTTMVSSPLVSQGRILTVWFSKRDKNLQIVLQPTMLSQNHLTVSRDLIQEVLSAERDVV